MRSDYWRMTLDYGAGVILQRVDQKPYQQLAIFSVGFYVERMQC